MKKSNNFVKNEKKEQIKDEIKTCILILFIYYMHVLPVKKKD